MKIETGPWDASSDAMSGRPLSPDFHALARLLDSFEPELVSCLLWKTRPRWRMDTRVQGDSLLFVPVRGRIHVSSGRRRGQAGPGQVVLFTEGLPQSARYVAGYRELVVYAIHVRYVDALARQAFDLFDLVSPTLPNAAQWHKRLAVLTALYNHDQHAGRSLGRVLIRALMTDLVLAGARLLESAPRGDPRILAVLTERVGSVTSEQTIVALAKRAGLSTVQFRKLFHRTFGMSPKRFLCRERLREAADLLRRTDAPVKTIAADSRFSSDHYFEQRFKKAYGVTPTQYRGRHRSSDI